MTYKQDFNQEQDITNFWRTFYTENPRGNAACRKRYIFALIIFFVFISFDSFSAECIDFDRVVVRETGDYSIYYHTELMADDCTGQVVMNASEYAVLRLYEAQNTQFTEITGEMASASFTFGMSGYLVFWFIGYKQRMAKQLIRQF